ncbi:gastrin/cholecystokinin-like peptide [Gastrophryne carolinensis]
MSAPALSSWKHDGHVASGSWSGLRKIRKWKEEMEKVCVSILLAMLVTAAICKPMTELESGRHGGQKKSSFTPEVSRRDLLASLTHEQRQLIMSQLLPQLISEMSNAEEHLQPMHDRDYAGWMDFGRRSTEDADS